MGTKETILELKVSKLYAECPSCDGSFKLGEAFLFDGTKSFPPEALDVRARLLNDFEQQKKDFEKRKKSLLVTEKSEITAKAVNIGKKMEVVFPILKDFKWALPDCRFLGEPIDMITFNGCSNNKIESMSFIEIKTGTARLNEHQKAVKDAVNDKKVSFKVVK
jgi:predicted Holliday junction resolvase-like endonuclease